MAGETTSGQRAVSGNAVAEDVLTEIRPGMTPADGLVDEQRRRRRAAEAAADAAEAAAAAAAVRASAAIAAAARAAADAEAAADLAVRAAGDADAAVAAERHAVQQSQAVNAATANETTTVGPAPVGPGPNGIAPNRIAPNGVRPSRHQVPGPVGVPGWALPPGDAAVARAATMTISATPLTDTPALSASATGGRVARRRAQEAAAAVALEANRDPDTHVFTVDEEDAAAPAPRRRRTRQDERASHPVTALLRRFRGRPDGRVLLVAAAVGGVVLVAAVIAGLFGGSRGSSDAGVTESAQSSVAAGQVAAPTPAAAGVDAAVDPTGKKAVAYLEALRAADVPTSDSGRSETEAAEVICRQLSSGADATDLVRALPAVLPTVNSKQAKRVVSIAQKEYCS